jgi:hypothetical protein
MCHVRSGAVVMNLDRHVGIFRGWNIALLKECPVLLSFAIYKHPTPPE